MKRTILLLMTVFAVTAANAQQKITLKQCKGDTVAYVKKNFEDGKARFIGQPFSKVVQEWRSQLPVAHLVLADAGSFRRDSLKNKVNGADLYFTSYEENALRSMNGKSYYLVSFTFAPPYYEDIYNLYNIRDEEDQPLGPRLYDKLKNYVVKDIFVFEMK